MIFSYPPAEAALTIGVTLRSMVGVPVDPLPRLREYLGAEHLVLGGSGRALLASLLTLLHKRGDPQRDLVLIPSYTCYSVAASIARTGLGLRLYDLDPGSFAPVLHSVSDTPGGRTLAVVTQHLFGVPTPAGEMADWARASGAVIIEDAAQGLGGRGLDGPLGTAGDFGLFSFGRGKPLPLGSGGGLIGRDAEVLALLSRAEGGAGVAELARAAAAGLLAGPLTYGLMEVLPLGLGQTPFDPDFSVEPLSRGMSHLLARGIHQLERLNRHRQLIAGVYRDLLDPYFSLVETEGVKPVFSRYPLLAGSGSIPRSLHCLGVRRMYPRCLADVPEIRSLISGDPGPLPGGRRIGEALITLPTHRRISPRLATRIARLVIDTYGSRDSGS